MLNLQYEILNIFTDGGSRGNPGPAAIGVNATADSGSVFQLSECLGRATNNTAEYMAVIKALEYLIANQIKSHRLNFMLDSELVVKQLNGQYKIKDQNLQQLSYMLKNLIVTLRNQSLCREIIFSHIRREQNKIADKLVNQALDRSK